MFSASGYGGTWKSRAAYRFVCEVSIYLAVGHDAWHDVAWAQRRLA